MRDMENENSRREVRKSVRYKLLLHRLCNFAVMTYFRSNAFRAILNSVTICAYCTYIPQRKLQKFAHKFSKWPE